MALLCTSAHPADGTYNALVHILQKKQGAITQGCYVLPLEGESVLFRQLVNKHGNMEKEALAVGVVEITLFHHHSQLAMQLHNVSCPRERSATNLHLF